MAPVVPSFDIPVATVVTIVMVGEIAMLIQTVGEEEGEAAVFKFTVTFTLVATSVHPPEVTVLRK